MIDMSTTRGRGVLTFLSYPDGGSGISPHDFQKFQKWYTSQKYRTFFVFLCYNWVYVFRFDLKSDT